ncbi:hypothetical protein C3F00_042580, partial [Pseudomonas sp. MWU13-2860]
DFPRGERQLQRMDLGDRHDHVNDQHPFASDRFLGGVARSDHAQLRIGMNGKKRQLMEGALQTTITRRGQMYVDEPVFRVVSRPAPITVAVMGAFGNEAPRPIDELERYNRVPLRWLQINQRGK